MPGKQLTLSTGEVITLKPFYSHAADLAYSEVRYAQDYEGKTPLAVVMAVIDATLPVVIDKVEKDGQTGKATKEWLGELPLPDYELLYQALMELRQESQTGLEAGKKMAEAVEAALMQTVGERRFPKRYVDLKLCRELGLSIREVGEMPEEEYQLWLAFLNAEGNAYEAAARHEQFLAGRKA